MTSILLGLGTAVMLLPALGVGVEESAPQLRSADLEHLFWDCDFAATRVVIDAATGAVCASATDELVRRRFRGDFTAFIKWWQIHKKTQHAKRAETPVVNVGPR